MRRQKSTKQETTKQQLVTSNKYGGFELQLLAIHSTTNVELRSKKKTATSERAGVLHKRT